MPEINLTAEVGRPSGSSHTRRLRASGKIPGVVYGHGVDPVAVAVDARELRHALNSEAGANALLNLDVGGTEHLTMARVLQRDPVRNAVVHVDFQIVRRDEVMTVEVPISLVGEAVAVHQGDGVVDQQMFSLTVHATPSAIPPHIEVDVSGLAIGDTIRVADVSLPAGVATEVDPEDPIVVGQPPQVSDLDLIPEADAEALGELAAAEQAAAEAEAAEGGEPGAAGGDASGAPSEGTSDKEG